MVAEHSVSNRRFFEKRVGYIRRENADMSSVNYKKNDLKSKGFCNTELNGP
jgi:hypothetical protein